MDVSERTDTCEEIVELLARANRGDADAWEELLDRHRGLVRSVGRGFRLSAADSDDLTQTMWLRLVEHQERIRDPRCLPGWIARAARNECLKMMRHQGREPVVDIRDDQVVEGFDDPVDRIARNAERRAYRAALSSLSAKEQELMHLLSIDPSLSYSEISERLDMPVGSIGPIRGRCVAKIRRHPEIVRLQRHEAA